MRVFAALPLPPAVVRSLAAALTPLRLRYSRLRWVPPEGLHVTLHFFGEVSDDAVAALRGALDDPALRGPAIRTRLGIPGQFPSSGNPRVLWVGFEKGVDEMSAFWGLFESKIAPLARYGGPRAEWLPDKRGFAPHITLARNNGGALDHGWREGLGVPPEDFLLQECVLFQSILGREGARYIPLRRIPFERGNR